MERGWLGMQGEVRSRASVVWTAGGASLPRRWDADGTEGRRGEVLRRWLEGEEGDEEDGE